jgi:hypothetical protein
MERELLSSQPRLNPVLLETLSAEVMEKGAELIRRMAAAEFGRDRAVASASDPSAAP